MNHSSYLRLSSNWVLVWASILLLAFVVQPTQSAGTERELLSVVDAPSDSFWDTGMRLCDIDANGKCHNGDYALSIIKFASGGIAAAALCIICFIIFMPVRFLCNGFGGKNKSYGCCPSSSDTRSYTKSEIIIVKVIAIIVLIPIVIAVGIGFRANSDISNSVETITASLVASGDDILNTILEARDIILSITNSSSARATINSAITTATDISDKLHNVDTTTNKYDGVREGLMIAGAICCIVIVVIGIICAIFNLRVFAMILGLFSFFILTIIWLSFGAHLVAGKFTYDVCVDIDLLIEDNTTASTTSVFKTGALANLWECNNNTELVNLQILVNDSINDAADSACSLRSQVCSNDPNWQCSSSPSCSYSTLTTVIDANHTVILDNGEPRSIAECAVNCTSSEYRNASIAIVQAVNLFVNYTDIYYNDVLPIISCQLAINVLTEVKGPLCDDLFDSVFGVAVSNLIVGIFYVPFIVAMIIGYKRFRAAE